MTAPRLLPLGGDLGARLHLAAVLKESERRRRQVSFVEDVCFDKQIAFIRDPARRKFLFTPRRSGKSTALGILLLQEAMQHPGRNFLYIGLTGASAQNTIYKDIVKRELDARRVKYRYNNASRIIALGNGSEIKLTGMDSSPKEMDKFLGGKYHLVVVDECQSFSQDLEQIITEKLSPAVTDYATSDATSGGGSGGGSICLGGTPGNNMGRHFWYRLTCTTAADPVDGWSGHSWSVMDNPHMSLQIANEWSRLAERNPNYQDDPVFRSQWLGEWVTDAGTRVYKFEARRNTISETSPIGASLLRAAREWEFVIGCDLGWEDATAFVVAAYSKTDNHFYVVESFKQVKATFDQVGAILTVLNKRYHPRQIVCDMVGGGKQLSESLRIKFQLPLVMAEKSEKQHHIGEMNSDFLGGKILLIAEKNRELAKELEELQVDRKALDKGDWKEAAKFDNHLADSQLYAWRFSQHFFATVPDNKPPPPPDLAALILAKRARTANPFTRRDPYAALDEQRSAQAIVARYRGTHV